MKALLQNRNLQIIIGVVLLAIIGFIITLGLDKAMDIFFLDESAYLVRGTNMFGKIPKRWGPLYCTWYKILNLFEGNLIQLFYLNFKAMAILPALLLFVVLSRYSKSLIFSFLIAACFLISAINLPVYPKVSVFCMMLILSALGFSSLFKSGYYKWLTFLAGTLLMSFARPEFYLSFLMIFAIGVGYAAIKRPAIQKQQWLALAGFVLVAVVLHLGLGNPLMVKLGDHNRSLIAFGEHYAYNSAKWNNSELFTWLTWEEIVRSDFGDIHSVSEAMQSNFKMFWKHISSNISNLFTGIFGVATSMVIPFKLGKVFTIIAGLLISVVFVLKVIQQRKSIPIELGYLTLLAIPTLISCVLVYPRNHYLVLLVPIIGLLFVFTFQFLKDDKNVALPVIVVLSALFMFFSPRSNEFKYFEFRKEEGVLNNQMAIARLENSKIAEPVKTLSNEGDFSAFLKKDLEWISAIQKKRDNFDEYLNQNNPDVIYITETMLKNPYYFEDESWQQFLINYSEKGYTKVELGTNIKEYFLVKSDLVGQF